MHLLQCNSDGKFSLTKFNNIPEYAILSHTWGADTEEVTYKDLIDGTGKNKVGYEKIRFCGEQARRDGLQYFWVDTCCIDKSSAVELAESINCMFRWYQNAARCYVYLSDVSVRSQDGKFVHVEWESAFCNSRWFTRGWTLQELLAPKVVDFYSRDHIRLGDKHSLGQHIVRITGIAIEALRGRPLSQFSIEERFSWAEKRQTTKEEDQAYCLLGIFGVFLSLIYGETHSNALRRLRKEIGESLDTKLQPIGLPSYNLSTVEVVKRTDIDVEYICEVEESSRRRLEIIIPDIIEDIYIAVMGVSGSGKSSFIKLITGQNISIDYSLKLCTENITSCSFIYKERLRIHLIEFPGFDNTYKSDTEVLHHIASWLTATYQENIQLNGIIYLHRIDDARIGGSADRSLAMLQKLCGPRCFPNIILVTTFWSFTEPDIGAARERDLVEREDFWGFGFMQSRGSAVLRHLGSRQSAMAILERSLRSRRPLTLQIQREINIEGLTLVETEAGQQVDEDLKRQKENYERELKKLREAMEDAPKMCD